MDATDVGPLGDGRRGHITGLFSRMMGATNFKSRIATTFEWGMWYLFECLLF